MGQAVKHSCSSLRLLEGGEPDPVNVLREETSRTTKLPHRTDSKVSTTVCNPFYEVTLKMNRPQSAAWMACTL